jgi:hypothetical protein
MVFNEKPKSMDVSLVSINTVVTGGHGPGAIEVDMSAEIPAEAKVAFVKATEGFTGSKIEPFAYIGKQVTKGIDYIFACELTSVTQNPTKSISIVTVHSMDNKLSFKALMTAIQENKVTEE